MLGIFSYSVMNFQSQSYLAGMAIWGRNLGQPCVQFLPYKFYYQSQRQERRKMVIFLITAFKRKGG